MAVCSMGRNGPQWTGKHDERYASTALDVGGCEWPLSILGLHLHATAPRRVVRPATARNDVAPPHLATEGNTV